MSCPAHQVVSKHLRHVKVHVDGSVPLIFKKLQPDPHCSCRQRGYSTFTWTCGKLQQDPPAAFQTPDSSDGGSVNDLVEKGELQKIRTFGEVPEEWMTSSTWKQLLRKTLKGVELMEGRRLMSVKLGLHLFRVNCGEVAGTPSPEGRHQDGFDYISVTVLERVNVKGGESIMADSKDGEPFFQGIIPPGEGLVFDDRQLWHDATSIEFEGMNSETNSGHRSVCVITVKDMVFFPVLPVRPAAPRKMAVVVRKDLEAGRTCNVVAHLAAGLATQVGGFEMHCLDYVDADGKIYPSISWHNIVILSGKKSTEGALSTLLQQCEALGLPYTAFTESMEDGGAEVQLERTKSLPSAEMKLDAVAIWGSPEDLEGLTKRFSLLK